jgi:hypothetical protein
MFRLNYITINIRGLQVRIPYYSLAGNPGNKRGLLRRINRDILKTRPGARNTIISKYSKTSLNYNYLFNFTTLIKRLNALF